MLKLRRLLALGADGLYRVNEKELPLLGYYANAIAEVVARADGRFEIEERPPQRLGQLALAQEATPLTGT